MLVWILVKLGPLGRVTRLNVGFSLSYGLSQFNGCYDTVENTTHEEMLQGRISGHYLDGQASLSSSYGVYSWIWL